MKVIIAADWYFGELYSEAFAKCFEELGHTVIRFCWNEYFKNYPYECHDGFTKKIKQAYYKIQNKYMLGPDFTSLNKDFFNLAKSENPDLIFIYRGSHIKRRTMSLIKKQTQSVIFGYNNDDPFSSKYKKYVWRHFLSSVFYYDHIFSYRKKNIKDYNSIGYKNTSLLRSYFIKDRNYFIHNESFIHKKHDVLFVGHFEDDGRDKVILTLLNQGVNVGLFGTGWSKSKLYEDILRMHGEVVPVYEDYNKVMNSTKIALVFLSKLNNDTYTRRCFEIPATKTLMLCEYTDDLASLFQPNLEAIYFTNGDEISGIIESLLCDQQLIESISENGYKRLIRDGHEAVDRVRQVIDVYVDIKSKLSN